jgi:hypothetical protein
MKRYRIMFYRQHFKYLCSLLSIKQDTQKEKVKSQKDQSKCQKCRATILFQKLKQHPKKADFLFLQIGPSFTHYF